jgi:hypothetical protein
MVSPPPSVGVWNLVSGAIVGVAGGWMRVHVLTIITYILKLCVICMFIISVMVIPVTDYRDLLDAMSSLGDDVWCVNVVVDRYSYTQKS